MKVCTDACLFGAYISPKKKGIGLDIGTGTGLLSLMLAQKTNALIEAIEIEKNAFEQAKNNIENSIFSSQINIFHTSLQNFKPHKKYDFIFSNPPFFSHTSKSTQKNKNIATHTDTLPFVDLIKFVIEHLEDDGIFWILLPPYESQLFTKQANKSLFLIQQVNIFQNIDKKQFRTIQAWQKQPSNNFEIEQFYIYKEKIIYSDEFINLLKDYYIIF